MSPGSPVSPVPPASIVAVLTGRPDSLEAVRWAAWLSQQAGLRLDVVHAYTREPGAGADAGSRARRESRERARARTWLAAALDECPALPHDLRLVVAEGELEQVVGANLREGDVLVSGSHGPAGLVSWGCRIRGCPVVLVPASGIAAGPGRDAPSTQPRRAATGVPA